MAPGAAEVTRKIEAEIAPQTVPRGPASRKDGNVARESLDPKPMYLERLREIVDLDVIRKANLRVAFDPMWGAARGYSDELLRDAGVQVATVHD